MVQHEVHFVLILTFKFLIICRIWVQYDWESCTDVVIAW